MSQPPSSRLVAARVVRRVLYDDAYSHIALDAELDGSDLEGRDRALATELAYGSLTRRVTLDALLEVFVRGGLGRLDPEVHAALLVGAYQLVHLDRVPDHAAVDESVQAVVAMGRGKARGFVNGVLRNVTRKKRRWPTAPDAASDLVGHIAFTGALPRWLAQLIVDEHQSEAKAIATSLVARPPLTLRVTGPADDDLPARRAELAESLKAVPSTLSPGALAAPSMSSAVSEALDGGSVVVQDEGSQLVSLLADPRPSMRVLDACAGLGGKIAHMADLTGGQAELVAVEPIESKLRLLRKAFVRQGMRAPTTHRGTLAALAPTLGTFDLVVVDAPCSGLGVVRRHPETRWRASRSSIADLSALQTRLLDAAAELVAPGGALIYSVCTFTAAEGPDNVDAFLERRGDFAVELSGHESVDWGTLPRRGQGISLLPHRYDTDGFFICKLRRDQHP